MGGVCAQYPEISPSEKTCWISQLIVVTRSNWITHSIIQLQHIRAHKIFLMLINRKIHLRKDSKSRGAPWGSRKRCLHLDGFFSCHKNYFNIFTWAVLTFSSVLSHFSLQTTHLLDMQKCSGACSHTVTAPRKLFHISRWQPVPLSGAHNERTVGHDECPVQKDLINELLSCL